MRRINLVIAAAAAILLVAQPVAASQPVKFELSPSSLTMTAPVGPNCPGSNCVYDVITVTNTIGRPLAISLPITEFTDAQFWDTQAGTCWQTYEVFGNPIPGHGSCTIQIGFRPLAVGTFPATMTVTKCTDWHVDGTTGKLNCDALDGSQSVSLTGVGT